MDTQVIDIISDFCLIKKKTSINILADIYLYYLYTLLIQNFYMTQSKHVHTLSFLIHTALPSRRTVSMNTLTSNYEQSPFFPQTLTKLVVPFIFLRFLPV